MKIFLTTSFKHVLGAQKNPLVEMVSFEYLQHTFWLKMKKIIFIYELLSRGLRVSFLCVHKQQMLYRDCSDVQTYVVSTQAPFLCSTQLSMEFIMLINVKMPTFISMIKTRYESLKPRKVFLLQNFSFYELSKFHGMKKVL